MDNLRLLYGNSTTIPELEDDEQENRDQQAIDYYNSSMVIDSIGSDEFEENYRVFIEEIKNQPTQLMKQTAQRILDKIYEVYDYSPFVELDLNDLENVYDIFNFVAFLEFDNEEFLSELWNQISIDVMNINVEKYVNKNINKILNILDSKLFISKYDKMITDFFRTYNKEMFSKWLINNTLKKQTIVSYNFKIRGV